MVYLSRIYTRIGDSGNTALSDGSRISKTDLRLAAYADVDEANSWLGLALASGDLPDEVAEILHRLQHELFDLGADLSTPVVEDSSTPALRISPEAIERLEQDCDRFNAALPPLTSFILPGGSTTSAQLHLARTVIRRAERNAWAAYSVHKQSMNSLTLRYLNRISDLIFILARVANQDSKEILWIPSHSKR